MFFAIIEMLGEPRILVTLSASYFPSFALFFSSLCIGNHMISTAIWIK